MRFYFILWVLGVPDFGTFLVQTPLLLQFGGPPFWGLRGSIQYPYLSQLHATGSPQQIVLLSAPHQRKPVKKSARWGKPHTSVRTTTVQHAFKATGREPKQTKPTIDGWAPTFPYGRQRLISYQNAVCTNVSLCRGRRDDIPTPVKTERGEVAVGFFFLLAVGVKASS